MGRWQKRRARERVCERERVRERDKALVAHEIDGSCERRIRHGDPQKAFETNKEGELSDRRPSCEEGDGE